MEDNLVTLECVGEGDRQTCSATSCYRIPSIAANTLSESVGHFSLSVSLSLLLLITSANIYKGQRGDKNNIKKLK